MKTEIAVIGSGPGGAITAALLAEAGRQVLLLEEGPHRPQGSTPPFSAEEMEEKYRRAGLTFAWGKPKVLFAEGRCVGGGSEINSGLYHRTPPEILERWQREFRLAQASEREMLPFFEANERDLSVGLIAGEASPASRKLLEGAQRLGWKAMEVPRWVDYRSESLALPFGGERRTMSASFIPRALKAGATLRADSRVQHLRQVRGGWELHLRNSERLKAEQVFVCAGALQTPALLRRSGIRQRIGESLALHPTVKLVAEFPEIINKIHAGVPVHQVKEFAPEMSFGGSLSSLPFLALALIDDPQALRDLPARWRRMSVFYAMIAGSNSGYVRSVSREAVAHYPLATSHLEQLAQGLERLGRVMFAAGAQCVYPSIGSPLRLRSPADLAQLPRQLARSTPGLMTIHLFSSCPMGEDPKLCATDSFGRVHGFRNLYISDASLLCSAPGVNPQGSIMAFARRNALKFLGRI